MSRLYKSIYSKHQREKKRKKIRSKRGEEDTEGIKEKGSRLQKGEHFAHVKKERVGRNPASVSACQK